MVVGVCVVYRHPHFYGTWDTFFLLDLFMVLHISHLFDSMLVRDCCRLLFCIWNVYYNHMSFITASTIYAESLVFFHSSIRYSKMKKWGLISLNGKKIPQVQRIIAQVHKNLLITFLLFIFFQKHNTQLFSRSFISRYAYNTVNIHVHVIWITIDACVKLIYQKYKCLIVKMESGPHWSKSIIYFFPWCSLGKTLM